MKLNLGCGNKKLPSFTNIDIRKEVEPDIVDDIATLTSLKNESADLIYACHVLEHFPFSDIYNILYRWYEVLKPNGILRLSVPDMDAVFAHYFYWKDLKDLRGFLWGRYDHEFNIHKSGWDYDTLKEEVENVGFKDIRRWNWEDTEPHKYIDDYSQVYWPRKECEYVNGTVYPLNKLMSLNMEATK